MGINFNKQETIIMRTNKNIWTLSVCCFATIVLTLCSCDKKKEIPSRLEYLAVQMSKGDSWSIIDKDGKEVVKEEYAPEARISAIHQGAYWVKEDGKLMLFSVSQPKKPLLDKSFADATELNAGRAAVSNPNQPIQIINTSGALVATLPKSIKRCYIFNSDGYALFMDSENKYGLIDSQGNIVIKAVYAEMKRPEDGAVLAKAKAEDKEYQILDMHGKKLGVIDLEKYDLANDIYYEDKILVRNSDGTDGLMVLDKTGKKLFDIRKGRWGTSYQDGYAAILVEGERWGVVDDKGESVIRTKYNKIWNMGEGQFAAEKGEKWGIVDANDETIIEFDYDNAIARLGEHYILKDGNFYTITGKDGKEIVSFDDLSLYAGTSSYVEYVDIDGLTTALAEAIGKYEQGTTAAQTAKELSLSESNYHYTSTITQKMNIDDKVSGEVRTWYEDYVVKEMTHQEKVNDGWFTETRTISDGYQWTKVRPTKILGEFRFSNMGIRIKDIFDNLCDKLGEGGRKTTSIGVFSKTVTLDGKSVEVQTTVFIDVNDNIGLNIEFQK